MGEGIKTRNFRYEVEAIGFRLKIKGNREGGK